METKDTGELLNISPEILKWAREESGLNVDQILSKLNKGKTVLTKSEYEKIENTGIIQLSILRKLAYDVYDRPVAVFLLKEPPKPIKKTVEDKLVYALMNCLIQANSDDFDIDGKLDNMCISAYEDAMSILEELGYLKSKNGRIYYFTEKGKNFYENYWKEVKI